MDFEPVIAVDFASWKDFKGTLFERLDAIKTKLLESESSGPRSFLFRGQACAAWPLWSSFDRLIEDNATSILSNPAKLETLYLSALKDFYVNGIEIGVLQRIGRYDGKIEFEQLKKDQSAFNELQALAQHYGLPTRLLDWSSSPYIAAFFAASEPDKCCSKQISIWCLDVVGSQNLFNDNDLVIQDRALDSENRQVWQRASFTINNTNLTRTDEMFLRKNNKFRMEPRHPVLFNCRLPMSECQKIVWDLDFMRINFLTVYPDVEGAVRYAKHRLQEQFSEEL